MDFPTVVSEVLKIVKRPDKVPDIRREVNAAINHFCVDANFPGDLTEINLAIDPAEYTQEIVRSSLPRFRKLWYMKRGGTKNYLRKLNTRQLFTKGCSETDTWYQIGSGIKIKMSALAASLDIGFFQYPPILTDSAGDFWLIESSPFMVIDRAASKIFLDIGDEAAARRHEAFAIAAYTSLRRDQSMPEPEA